MSLREGCKKILVADSFSLMNRLIKTQKRAISVDSKLYILFLLLNSFTLNALINNSIYALIMPWPEDGYFQQLKVFFKIKLMFYLFRISYTCQLEYDLLMQEVSCFHCIYILGKSVIKNVGLPT